MSRKPRTPKQYSCVCKICNENFFAATRTTVYCSISCSRKNQYKKHMLDYNWRLRKLLSMAKNRAKEKQVNFDLTEQYLMYLWEEQLGCCAITGILFDLSGSDKYTVNPNAPSIDRIVPHLGYVQGNIRLVKYQVNTAMGEYGYAELLNLAKEILNGVAHA